MTLNELLAMQAELNQHCAGRPTKDQLNWAIAAEIGELANATKANWCWWKRNDKAISNESRAEIAAEIADILCFLLTGVLQFQKASKSAWQWGCFDYPIADLSHIERAIGGSSYGLAIVHLGAIAAHLGYSREEIEAAYIAKVEVNRKRWEDVA